MGSQRPTEALNALGKLRVHDGVSGLHVAKAMGIGPGRLSFIECADLGTLRVATVARYLGALGYELHLTAVGNGAAREMVYP